MNYSTYIDRMTGLYSTVNEQKYNSEFIEEYLNVDWHAYFACLGLHQVTPLVNCLHHRAGLNSYIGQDENAYLNTIHKANNERNLKIVLQFKLLEELLSKHEIPVLPLKGLALLLDSSFKDSSCRILVDVDILVHPRNVTEAVDLLLKNGYEQEENQYSVEGEPDFRNLPQYAGHHVPKLIKKNSEAPVEIHIALDQPFFKSKQKKLLAYAWSSAITNTSSESLYMHRSSDIFQLLHCVYSSLTKDKGTLLGTVDFRHLEDYGHLRKKIEQNESLHELKAIAKSIGMISELDFFEYQYRHYICSDTQQSASSTILKLKAAYLNNIHNFPFIVPALFALTQSVRYLTHLFSVNSLKRQFGPVPFQKALLLRVRHIANRAKTVINGLN